MLSSGEHTADTIAALAATAELALDDIKRNASGDIAGWLDLQLSNTHKLLRLVKREALALAEVISDVELATRPPFPGNGNKPDVTPEPAASSPNGPGFARRCLQAIEPWYDWDRINITRLDARERDFSDESEGHARRFSLQWLGAHLSMQIGRVPPKPSDERIIANKRAVAGGAK